MLISSFNEVLAYTTDTFTLGGSASESYGALEETNVIHETGRLIVVYGLTDTTNRTLYVKVYATDGSLEGTFSNNYGAGGLNAYYLINAVQSFNSTHALIWSVCVYGGQTDLKWMAYLFHVVTGTFTEYTVNDINRGGLPWQLRGFMTATYNGDFFAIGHSSFTGNNTMLHLLKFDSGTSTLTHEDSLQTDPAYQTVLSSPFGFQDPDNLDKLYFLTMVAESSTPVYYSADLDGLTLTYHAVAGSNGNFNRDNRRHVHYLGGGIETSGADKYLYHTWIYSNVSNTVRNVVLRQAVIQYDLGYILPVNITAQDVRTGIITPTWNAETTEAWSMGVLNDYDEFEVWYADYVGGANYISHQIYNVTDFFNMGVASFNLFSEEEETSLVFPYNVAEVWISRKTNGVFQYNINSLTNPDDAFVYGGLTAFSDSWDITLTYTPYESPLDTDSNYMFTVQTLNNGAGTQATLLKYFDGSLVNSAETSTYGVNRFNFGVGIGGTYNFTFQIYYNGVFEYEEVFELQWVDTDSQDVSTGNVLPLTINALTTALPVGFIMLGCPVLFYEIMGENFIGVLIGFIIGLGIATAIGLIPFYMTFLGVLGVVLAFVFMSRQGV
jgi:hypothetical protein